MYLLTLLLLFFLPNTPTPTLAQPSTCIQGPHCTSRGWFCNQGCDTAVLDSAECARCLYCRRESSACGFVDVSGTWTGAAEDPDPPSAALCEACARGCWCYGDWYCMDDGAGPPEAGSSRVKTGTRGGKGVRYGEIGLGRGSRVKGGIRGEGLEVWDRRVWRLIRHGIGKCVYDGAVKR